MNPHIINLCLINGVSFQKVIRREKSLTSVRYSKLHILIYRTFRIAKDYFILPNKLMFITGILRKNGFPLHYSQNVPKELLSQLFSTKILLLILQCLKIWFTCNYLISVRHIMERKLRSLNIKYYTTVDLMMLRYYWV